MNFKLDGMKITFPLTDIIDNLTLEEKHEIAEYLACDKELVSELDREVKDLAVAATDMLAGWRYIRQAHGDLYGVGWDRAENAMTMALSFYRFRIDDALKLLSETIRKEALVRPARTSSA